MLGNTSTPLARSLRWRASGTLVNIKPIALSTSRSISAADPAPAAGAVPSTGNATTSAIRSTPRRSLSIVVSPWFSRPLEQRGLPRQFVGDERAGPVPDLAEPRDLA